MLILLWLDWFIAFINLYLVILDVHFHIIFSRETQCKDVEDTDKLWKVHYHQQQPQLQK